MSGRVLAVPFIVLGCVMLGDASVLGQSNTAVLRTPHGDPDIQGMFTFRTITPLERPRELVGKETLTEEEAAAFEASERTRLNRDLFDPELGAPSAGYQPRADGGVLSYNEFWYERGIELTKDHRTSLIVDPPDGRLPWKEETGQARASNQLNLRNGFADSYTDRSLSDRCIMGFNSGPPMTSGAYNNNVLILQTPDHMVILNEMVHNARIIPIDGRVHGAIPQWAGDSRGHWEGDTLVVETTGFLRETAARGSSKDTHLIERFRRVDANTVMYEFTVEDRSSFTRSWTAILPFRRTDGPLFEYACHEGNIGMHGILAGARNLDTQSVDETR